VTGHRGSVFLATVLVLMLGVLVRPPAGIAAQEGGIGIFPVRVEIADALRGGEYLRTVTVVNRESVDFKLLYVAEGEVGAWITVHSESDPTVQLQELIAPAGKDTRFLLRIAVPDDAANGEHTGTVLFQGTAAASESEDSGVGVSIGIGADILLNVTGNQNLSGKVLGLAVDDAEAGQPPVRLRMQFQNDGNVDATPVVNWQIRDSAGAVVGDVSYSDTVVPPGLISEIISEWDSSDAPEGAYTALVTVVLGTEPVYQQEVPFQLLPIGTLTRGGTLMRISLDGDPQPGSVAKVIAAFTNSGQIDTRAVFAAEVYREGQLIQTIESRERLVIVGELALLEAFFDVPEAGAYRIRGKVNYEGKETEVQELEFSIAVPASNTDTAQANPADVPVESQPSQSEASAMGSPWIWIAAGAALAMVAGAIAFVIGRVRGTPASSRRAVTSQGQTRY
jgi:hypothetical protein